MYCFNKEGCPNKHQILTYFPQFGGAPYLQILIEGHANANPKIGGKVVTPHDRTRDAYVTKP